MKPNPSNEKQALSEQCKQVVSFGKYSRWAEAGMTEDQLTALFWAVGEFGYRSIHLAEILRSHAPDHADRPAFYRLVCGLDIIAQFSYGSFIGLNEYMTRMRETREKLETSPQSRRQFGEGAEDFKEFTRYVYGT
jgi:hypothetical protein